jgi:hypothetical protein
VVKAGCGVLVATYAGIRRRSSRCRAERGPDFHQIVRAEEHGEPSTWFESARLLR